MLEIDNVKVALDSEAGLVKAIDGMRLTLRRGETFALVGESGCGKSTVPSRPMAANQSSVACVGASQT